jgi:putative ABC transport system permease protein
MAMFINHLKSGYRNLVKYKGFSLINLVGLTLGLSAIMVLAFLLYQFITVNSQFQNKERIYYVRTQSANGGIHKQTPFPFLQEALRTCPQIEAGTHAQTWNNPWLKHGQKEFQQTTWYVEPGFFRVFTFPLAYGNPLTALQQKHSVVLSTDVALKLFGQTNVVGQTLIADDSIQLTVTGVMEPIPGNSTFRPEVLLTSALLMDNPEFREMADWYNTFAENYFLLKPGADAQLVSAQLNNIVQQHYHADNRNERLMLTPLNDFVRNEAGNLVQVIVKGQIGTILFILLIIVANLVNLNAATMFTRAKEVAVKQMLGSSKRQIIMQFCVENAMLIFVSMLLAFLLFNAVLLPQINSMIADRFGAMLPDIQRDYPLALGFVAAGLIIVIIAGSYPAFHLISLKVTDIVKGQISRTGNRSITRNVFATIQFVLAITFIGVSIILSRQINHMKSAAMGFNKENVLVVPMHLAYKDFSAAHARFNALLNDMRANPYIKSISTSEDIPTAYHSNYNTYYDPVTGKEAKIRVAYTDAGMLPVYEIPVIEGRNFNNVPFEQEASNIIINRKAMQALGWTSAAGKQLKAKGSNETVTVIGVMEDFHYQDLTRNVEPLMHRYGEAQQLGYTWLSLRIDPARTNEIVQLLQAGFNEMPSRRTFSYELLESRIDQQYTLLNGILKVTNYVSILTVLIASMGMFGLVALFARQRVKEIGIRKVLGAGVPDILRMLLQNYVLIIMVATAIAAPMVLIVMGRWLQDFAVRIDVSVWMPVMAGIIALLVALAIVLMLAIKAAKANPAKSLRTE